MQPLLQNRINNEICLELADNSVVQKSAIDFFQLQKVDRRTVGSQAALRAEQFINANRRLSATLDVTISRDYDGNDVSLILKSGNTVGATPLISPTSAQHDLGLVVQPRFPWAGIGPMLANMGWRIVPSPLKLPLLRRSERKVPAWVMASTILVRLAALVNSLTRKFEIGHEHRDSPRGRVHWEQYVRRQLPMGRFLSIPCSYPDLQQDRKLKGAIRYTLDKQIKSLQTQTQHGSFVHRLIELAQDLTRQVQDAPLYIPRSLDLRSWVQRPLRSDHFLDGLQAIEWTMDDRSLAGMSDLAGLPWRMPMDQFFEAWVETIFAGVARDTGATIKAGRLLQTTHGIDWQPSFLGSQKSLVPDIWLEWDSTTLIIDAKYKRHWEELSQHSWSKVEDDLRDNHRRDLLQVLAYANLASTPNVIACLTYPCRSATWRVLKDSNRLIHKAIIAVGTRSLHLWLTAVPINVESDDMRSVFTATIRSILAAFQPT